MIRAFLAIAPPDPVRDALVEIQAGAPAGRPVTWDILHLTLAFLDAQPAQMLREVTASLVNLHGAEFHARITGTDVLGGRRPRGLAAMVGADQPLIDLHDRIRRRLRGAGIDLPRTRFRPHITLIRFGPRLADADSAALARFLAAKAPPRIAFPVSRFALYRSTLTPDGPIYDQMAEFELAPDAGA